MASTVTNEAVPYTGGGTIGVKRGTLNIGVYATNGVTVTATQFGLATLDHLDLGNAAGVIFEWDKVNGKIKAYRQKDPANAGGADIALPEVANAVDLSAVSVRFEARGT